VGRFLAYLSLLALLAAGAAWYSQGLNGLKLSFFSAGDETAGDGVRTEWLEQLYSRNPREARTATQRVEKLGERSIPILRAALREDDRERRRAALQACVILEQTAAPLIPDVARQLRAGDVTEEAAMALSFMGPGAFGPLRDALTSADPALRREAIRSIGKLTSRAPLEARQVTPLLVTAMKDPADSVRAVAATYLGIIHDTAAAAVPALIAGLEDPSIEVRRASATALGSFGAEAEPAIPALRKARGDKDPDLAREAGRALIRVQSPER
jgi:HEAT repeat protein